MINLVATIEDLKLKTALLLEDRIQMNIPRQNSPESPESDFRPPSKHKPKTDKKVKKSRFKVYKANKEEEEKSDQSWYENESSVVDNSSIVDKNYGNQKTYIKHGTIYHLEDMMFDLLQDQDGLL